MPINYSLVFVSAVVINKKRPLEPIPVAASAGVVLKAPVINTNLSRHFSRLKYDDHQEATF